MKWVSDMVEMPLEEQPPASAWLPLPDEEGKVNMGLLSLDSVSEVGFRYGRNAFRGTATSFSLVAIAR